MVLDKNILAGRFFEQKKKGQTALEKLLTSPTVGVLVSDFLALLGTMRQTVLRTSFLEACRSLYRIIAAIQSCPDTYRQLRKW
jgi:hypothetical protein